MTTPMRNILIFGGNRYVGKRLAHLLKENGDRVTLINRSGPVLNDKQLQVDDRQSPDETNHVDQNILADRNDVPQILAALKNSRWDLVYDFSCIYPIDAGSGLQVVETTPCPYIVISSQSVYGPGANVREDDFNPHNHKITDTKSKDLPYPEAKRQMEAVFFQQKNFPVSAVRFPIILGEDDYTQRLLFHVKKILQEQDIFLPNPNAKISFVQAGDAAKFLVALGKNFCEGPINFCSAEPISLKEVMKQISEKTHKPIILAEQKGETNVSPFGIESDWWMNTDKAQLHNFSARKIMEWLPELIDNYLLRAAHGVTAV